jgi:hypothetical protein
MIHVKPHLDRLLLMACALTIALTLVVLSGCGTILPPTPQTTAERVAVTITSVTAARQTASALLTAGKISAADADNLQKQADNVRDATIVVRQLLTVDPAAADAKMQQTRTLLLALQTYLAAKEAKP